MIFSYSTALCVSTDSGVPEELLFEPDDEILVTPV